MKAALLHWLLVSVALAMPTRAEEKVAAPVEKAKEEAKVKPSFSARIESMNRDGKKYRVTVSLALVTDGFKPLHVELPDQWGRTRFLHKDGDKVSASEDTALQHPGSFSGFVMTNADPLKFVYEGEVEEGGVIHFDESDQRLPVYAQKFQLGVRMSLWVADYSAGTSRIETIDSDWVDADFPFPVAKPEPKKPEGTSVPSLPEVPK